MKNYYFILLFWFFSICFQGFSQENLIYNHILSLKNSGTTFKKESGFFSRAVPESNILEQFIDPRNVDFLIFKRDLDSQMGNAIELTLMDGVHLELLKVQDSFYDYNVTLSEGEKRASNRNIHHYRGIVKGDNKSIVALSIYENEVKGIISTDEGNFNISLDIESGKHVYFNEKNLKSKFDFSCEPRELGESVQYANEILSYVSKSEINSADNCVRLYFETEFDIFQTFGNSILVEFFVSSIFNQVSTIYQNENISTSLSEIFIWTSVDPFTFNSPSAVLSQFQNFRTSFDGDLGQLLTFREIGGGFAAEIGSLCSSNVEDRLSVSGITNNITLVPAYSWTVFVIAHEFGHLFGSRHTHACVWNGNNTVIDGCAGPENIACQVGSVPPAGGTIMSYCHRKSVGINFSLGFGVQPGNVIRNNVANASCLCSCGISTISGPDYLCSSDFFTLDNPPSGGSISWNVAPANLFSGSTSGNSNIANLSIQSGSRGLAILTYTFLTSCGNIEVKKPFWVGKAYLEIIGPYDFQFNTVQNFSSQGGYPYVMHVGLMGVINYNWSISPSGYEWIGGNGSSGISLSISNPGSYSLELDVTNPCGIIGSEIPLFVSDYSSFFTIYPNPTSDILFIRISDENVSMAADVSGFMVSLYNDEGRFVKESRGDKELSLDISDLKNGIYHINIIYKDKIIKKHIVKK